MWRLRADVRQVTGLATHSAGATRLVPAVKVELVEADGGFLLIRFSREGFAGDTWHATVAEGKGQAEFEFTVGTEDWIEDRGT